MVDCYNHPPYNKLTERVNQSELVIVSPDQTLQFIYIFNISAKNYYFHKRPRRQYGAKQGRGCGPKAVLRAAHARDREENRDRLPGQEEVPQRCYQVKSRVKAPLESHVKESAMLLFFRRLYIHIAQLITIKFSHDANQV